MGSLRDSVESLAVVGPDWVGLLTSVGSGWMETAMHR